MTTQRSDQIDAGTPGTVFSVVLRTEPRTPLSRSLTAGEVYTGSSHQGFIDTFGRAPACRGHFDPVTGSLQGSRERIVQQHNPESDRLLNTEGNTSCHSANPDC